MRPFDLFSRSEIAAELVSERGYTISEAAIEVGIDWGAVKDACFRRGIVPTAKAAVRAMDASARNGVLTHKCDNTERNKSILFLRRQGLSYGQIAGELSVTRCVVAGVINRAKQASA